MMAGKKKDNPQLPLFHIRIPPARVFTRNEAEAMMHEERASAFIMVAEYILKHQLSFEQVHELLTSTADEAKAQAMVVRLRDQL